jgi:hypothetical protein
VNCFWLLADCPPASVLAQYYFRKVGSAAGPKSADETRIGAIFTGGRLSFPPPAQLDCPRNDRITLPLRPPSFCPLRCLPPCREPHSLVYCCFVFIGGLLTPGPRPPLYFAICRVSAPIALPLCPQRSPVPSQPPPPCAAAVALCAAAALRAAADAAPPPCCRRHRAAATIAASALPPPRCRHRAVRRRRASRYRRRRHARPPSRCAPPPRFALPPPPLTLPPTRHRRHAAADIALPPLSQPPRCRHRAATVALCAATALRAAATAAAAAAAATFTRCELSDSPWCEPNTSLGVLVVS